MGPYHSSSVPGWPSGMLVEEGRGQSNREYHGRGHRDFAAIDWQSMRISEGGSGHFILSGWSIRGDVVLGLWAAAVEGGGWGMCCERRHRVSGGRCPVLSERGLGVSAQ